MKPSAYKHMAAFHRVMGFEPTARRRHQRMASIANAPVDAVYWDGINGKWVTISDCGVQTRMSIERQLNHGSRK